MVLISAIGTDCDDEKAAPCPPTISASGVSSTQIDVSWSDGVGPTATSYNLEWCTNASCIPSTAINGVAKRIYKAHGHTQKNKRNYSMRIHSLKEYN
jgi:hypothetical protein